MKRIIDFFIKIFRLIFPKKIKPRDETAPILYSKPYYDRQIMRYCQRLTNKRFRRNKRRHKPRAEVRCYP